MDMEVLTKTAGTTEEGGLQLAGLNEPMEEVRISAAAFHDATEAGTRITAGTMLDPLDLDQEDDLEVVVSLKGLSRVSFVAAHTGVRFEAEGVGVDPAAWMMAPRRLFDGQPAYRACVEREHFLRAVLLHGLSLGLDADPDEIDDLLADQEEMEVDVAALP